MDVNQSWQIENKSTDLHSSNANGLYDIDKSAPTNAYERDRLHRQGPVCHGVETVGRSGCIKSRRHPGKEN